MQRISSLILGCSLVLTLEPATEQAQHPCRLQGMTWKVSTNPLAYSALDKIPISVYRQGPVMSGQSGPEPADGSKLKPGAFDLKIPSGAPINVLFMDPSGQLLPELQSLAAAPEMQHTIHVTLLTVAQARELKIDPYKHIQSIISQLEAHGVTKDDKFMQQLLMLLEKLG